VPVGTTDGRKRFWIAHAAWPGAGFTLLLFAILEFDVDARLAEALFYNRESHAWIGAHTWWAEAWIHTGGRNMVLAIAVATLATLIGGCFAPRVGGWRRAALFVFLAIGLSTGVVGILKHVTNVDCPWSLAAYGGTPSLNGAACFPGAHSASGFALVCFYFLLRERSRRAALAALMTGLGVGVLFAFGQEARGAHFLSHDLTSAVLVWYIQLGLYAGLFSSTLRGREPSARQSPSFDRHPPLAAATAAPPPAPSASTAETVGSRLPRTAAHRRRSSDPCHSG
jgi:membrane-associated PAP2 superfamily phosphatase